MNLEALFKSTGSAFSGRFFLVSTLPTALAGAYMLVLFQAGAPGPVRFARAWHTTAELGTGQILLLLLTVTAVGVVTLPLQLPLVRWLQGYWPQSLDWLARRFTARQLDRRGELVTDVPEGASDEVRQRQSELGAKQRSRYPREPLVRATALGNALAAAEASAGLAYGFDAPAVLLRLETVLGERVREALADRRNTLDAAARISVTAALCVPLTVWLLWRSGWWLLLAALLAAVSRLAYVAAVHAAVAYGECIAAAFDLHRFDLLNALHLPLPADLHEERRLNRDLSRMWRQGMLPEIHYVHGPDPVPDPDPDAPARGTAPGA